MQTRLVSSLGRRTKEVMCVLSACLLSLGAASAQIATTTAVSASASQIPQGTTPVLTVNVKASNGSTPDATASCTVQTRGYGAAYSGSLVNGASALSISSLANDPVGTYTLACKYSGSASYAASSAATVTVQVVAKMATKAALTLSSAKVVKGNAPTATVAVSASNNSTSDGSVSCIIRARGYGAAYASKVVNGSASLSLSSLAFVPVGTYPLYCTYMGSASYATSTAAPQNIQIVAQ